MCSFTLCDNADQEDGNCMLQLQSSFCRCWITCYLDAFKGLTNQQHSEALLPLEGTVS